MDTLIQAQSLPAAVPSVMPDMSGDNGVAPLPRLTALARDGNNELIEQLAEFNAFEIIRLPFDADVAHINSLRPAVIGLFADNDNETVDTSRRLLMSNLVAPLIVLTPEVDSFREALLLEMGARDVVMLN